MVLRSPVVHQEVPGVLHTVVQLLICCGLPWELLGGPEEPKGGVLASPWRSTGSVVMTTGTPNLEIQPATRASAQAVAVVEDRGITSIHLVVLSTMVITWV